MVALARAAEIEARLDGLGTANAVVTWDTHPRTVIIRMAAWRRRCRPGSRTAPRRHCVEQRPAARAKVVLDARDHPRRQPRRPAAELRAAGRPSRSAPCRRWTGPDQQSPPNGRTPPVTDGSPIAAPQGGFRVSGHLTRSPRRRGVLHGSCQYTGFRAVPREQLVREARTRSCRGRSGRPRPSLHAKVTGWCPRCTLPPPGYQPPYSPPRRRHTVDLVAGRTAERLFVGQCRVELGRGPAAAADRRPAGPEGHSKPRASPARPRRHALMTSCAVSRVDTGPHRGYRRGWSPGTVGSGPARALDHGRYAPNPSSTGLGKVPVCPSMAKNASGKGNAAHHRAEDVTLIPLRRQPVPLPLSQPRSTTCRLLTALARAGVHLVRHGRRADLAQSEAARWPVRGRPSAGWCARTTTDRRPTAPAPDSTSVQRPRVHLTDGGETSVNPRNLATRLSRSASREASPPKVCPARCPSAPDAAQRVPVDQLAQPVHDQGLLGGRGEPFAQGGGLRRDVVRPAGHHQVAVQRGCWVSWPPPRRRARTPVPATAGSAAARRSR